MGTSFPEEKLNLCHLAQYTAQKCPLDPLSNENGHPKEKALATPAGPGTFDAMNSDQDVLPAKGVPANAATQPIQTQMP